jgi:hypothetical protein
VNPGRRSARAQQRAGPSPENTRSIDVRFQSIAAPTISRYVLFERQRLKDHNIEKEVVGACVDELKIIRRLAGSAASPGAGSSSAAKGMESAHFPLLACNAPGGLPQAPGHAA